MSSAEHQLMFIGSSCHLSTCNLNDFLPLKCAHCAHTFCSSHYLPKEHSCEKFDPAAHDRVAPNCPLCNVPVAYPLGGDPNEAMERHFDGDCEAMGKRQAAKSNKPICGKAKCGKVLVVPITCQTCNQQFCPEHRFPSTHVCKSTKAAAAPARFEPKPKKLSNLLRPTQTASTSQPAQAASRSLAENKPNQPRLAASSSAVPAKVNAGPSSAVSEVKGSKPLPFSKTDRCDPSPPPYTSSKPTSLPELRPLFALPLAPPPLFGAPRSLQLIPTRV